MGPVEQFAQDYAGCLEEGTVIALYRVPQAPCNGTSTPLVDESESAEHNEVCVPAWGQNVLLCPNGVIPAQTPIWGTVSKALVPTTMENEEDHQALSELVSRLKDKSIMAMAVLLLPEGGCFDREANKVMLNRFSALGQMQFDEVLADPLPEPAAIQSVIRKFVSMARVSGCRMREILAMEPSPPNEPRVRELRLQYRDLLWNQIPTMLMRHMPKMDKELVETALQIGNYRLIKHIPGPQTIHVVARHEDTNERCMLKVVDKRSIVDAVGLESIYKELRYLRDLLRHEHIIRCHEALQSAHRVYLVLEYAGDICLATMVSECPGRRLPVASALRYFSQVVSAVHYCHNVSCALRALSMDGILVYSVGNRRICKIIEFCEITSCDANTMATKAMSLTSLPYFAPETALGDPYQPFAVDSWLVGVLLLEMAGGIGSMAVVAGFVDGGWLSEVSQRILAWLQTAGAHARALGAMGNVRDAQVEAMLRLLLKMPPENRATTHNIMALLSTWEFNHVD